MFMNMLPYKKFINKKNTYANLRMPKPGIEPGTFRSSV